MPPLRRRDVLHLAWPIVLSQATSALPGLVDTAAIGRTGGAVELAAVALAAMVFTFTYWGFGFLRMATTAQTAQACGAGDPAESHAVLARALLVGGALGLGLVALLPFLGGPALHLFGADAAVEAEARRYLDLRLIGAPAALAGYAVNGWLLGTGRTRGLLAYQLVLNGGNAALDALFVGWLGAGAAGIGLGTALAEWGALGVGLWLVRDGLRDRAPLWQPERLTAMFRANRDIMIRTLALLTAFAWFLHAGARTGPVALAANQVLMQLVAVSAFLLDAFAFVAEKEVGEAIGARDAGRLRRAIRRTSELALLGGLAFTLLWATTGVQVIDALVVDPAVRTAARGVLPWTALVPLLGVPAFQLDGIFLGATRGRALRTAAVAATAAYVLTDLALRPWGHEGLWTAFLAMYVYRALALALGLPGLFAAAQSAAQPSSEPHRQRST